MTADLSLSVVNNTVTPPTTDTSRLSWATSLFYFGMLAGLYPMTFALQRFNVGRVLGGVVTLWALICMLTAAVTTYQGLYAQRFFLGFVESIIPTGFMCIISGYYTQQEQSLRQSWWFSSTGLFTIIGGALNYGSNHNRVSEALAIYLSVGWCSHISIRTLVLCSPQLTSLCMVPVKRGASRGSGAPETRSDRRAMRDT
jgi:MFS family permease